MAFQVSLPKVALGERVSVLEVGLQLYITLLYYILSVSLRFYSFFFFVACLPKLT